MWKKAFCLLACPVLAFGTLTACSKSEILKTDKEEINLILKVPMMKMNCVSDSSIREAYDMLALAAREFSETYEEADVTFDVVKFEYKNEDAYISECFDTESATDILFEGYFNMAGYIHTGRVVPLDDIISDEIRADMDNMTWTLSSVDNKTYMMPFFTLQNTLGYNKKMFHDAGLDKYISDEPVIQSWTLKEWEDILSALRDTVPTSSFPMFMYAKNEQGDTHIMTLLRRNGSTFFDEEGYFNLETKEGIAALKWIKTSYEKGYFPRGCENLEILDVDPLFGNNQMAIHANNMATFQDYPENSVGLVNFPSPNGKGYATSFLTGFEIFDNGDETKVKVAKDFLKFFYASEKYMDMSAGALPTSKTVLARYKDDIYMAEAYLNNAENVVDFTANNPNWRGVRNTFYLHIRDLLTGDRTPKQVAQDIDATCNAAIDEGRNTSTLHP